jgi:hypothetical protein
MEASNALRLSSTIGVFSLPRKAYHAELADALGATLRHLDELKMTRPDDPELQELKLSRFCPNSQIQ